MNYQGLIGLLLTTSSLYAAIPDIAPEQHLYPHTGNFRLNYDPFIKMPHHLQNISLVGIHYLADINPSFYGGIGGYGTVTGTQGGLFTVGMTGGLHHEILPRLWGDIAFFVGGGGGRSSFTGGGLMLKPQAGLAYDMPLGRLGVYYSYIDFPNGEIHSQQVGFQFDMPVTVDYLPPCDRRLGQLLQLETLQPALNEWIHFQRNDFSLLAQGYFQRQGTRNTENHLQAGTIALVGAEFAHYFSGDTFWWLKTAGAFHGIPNGYMDVVGGLGQHVALGASPFALVPQMGLGAGGGGLVNTGGGFLVNPVLGLEWDLFPNYSLRLSSGYVWAPQGQLQAVPLTGELIYHLDVATPSTSASDAPPNGHYYAQGWRIQMFNQTYTRPQRASLPTTSSAELIGVQIDQIFTPWFFMAYQGAGAYSGDHVGGYATGMIGPGIQSETYHCLQGFAEFLIGAGGGGNLALNGGAIIEPLVGLRYTLSPMIGLQASISDIKALQSDLNTPVIQAGLYVRFDMLNEVRT